MNPSKAAVQLLTPMILLIGINILFPINFTIFFISCALAILCSMFFDGRLVAWSIITTACVLVSLNYLRPPAYVYNNASHNVVAVKGYDSPGPIYLVNDKSHRRAFFDSEKYKGNLIVSPTKKNEVSLSGNLYSDPLYLFHPEKDSYYELVNKKNCLPFKDSVSFSLNGYSLTLNVITDVTAKKTKLEKLFNRIIGKEVKGDGTTNIITFKTDSIRRDTSTFKKIIKEGYPLQDIIRGAGPCSSKEEEILSLLSNVSIIRDTIWSESQNHTNQDITWYLTNIPSTKLSISCDGHHINPEIHYIDKIVLHKGERIFIGYGGNKTPSAYFTSEDGRVKMSFDMPLMNGFPSDTSSNKLAIISSSKNELLQSNIKEAFLFDLFSNDNNVHHFNASIAYQTDPSPTPFEINVIDTYGATDWKAQSKDAINGVKHFLLSAKGEKGGRWMVDVVDLKVASPIDGSQTKWLNGRFLILLLLGCSLFTFLTLVFSGHSHESFNKSINIFNVWLFFLPLLTMRLYLLWRIAVFPPIQNISKAEFLRYRMENGASQNAMIITLACVATLVIVTIILLIVTNLRSNGHNKIILLSEKNAKPIYFILLLGSTFGLISGLVLGNIVIPILVFLVNEYIAQKYILHNTIIYRIVNALLAFFIIMIGDPGYAMMFLIFLCLYYLIQAIVFILSSSAPSYKKNAAIRIRNILAIATGIIVIFAPIIVAQLYSNKLICGIRVSSLSFLFWGVCVSCAVLWVVRILYGKRYAIIGSHVALILVAALVTIGPQFLENNKHFKYRALIHTQSVGQILTNEDVADRNSQRLLEASQNQWFLQYHNNLGTDRIAQRGILHLYPHFKKGVSWNTQISDVICSRYIIGELSAVVPIVIALFYLIFFLGCFKMKNSSPAGRSITYAAGLLLLVQTTFVWMANTNRMIFFGQDFPFMSQNARCTLFLFILLLSVIMISSAQHTSKVEELMTDGLSNEGFKEFGKKPSLVFSIMFTVIFFIVFISGNKYPAIYSGRKAIEFNAGEAMARAETDFGKINQLLSVFKTDAHLSNGEDLTETWEIINKKIHIDAAVEKLIDAKEIAPFSASLYHAFRDNLKHSNDIENIVHLQYIISSKSYRLALNRGYYRLRAPEMAKSNWQGHVYAYDDASYSDNLRTTECIDDGVKIYRIPRTWLQNKNQVLGIADVRQEWKRKQWVQILRATDGNHPVIAPTFIIRPDESLECSFEKDIYIHQLDGETENLLSKNMIVNGNNTFFYPMGEKFFWIKDFTEMISANADGEENCYLSIDRSLSELIYRDMKETGMTMSVVALDGFGNIRVMEDINKRALYNPDPNNSKQIEAMIEQSYLNPNSKEDTKLFGNMNLTYMLPGPGSSLKPITFAAVSSQTNKVDWANLYLHVPDLKYAEKGYYKINKYGPEYTYPESKPFKSLYGDENPGSEWVDNTFYLKKSSNYYNALVTYLGFFEHYELNNLVGDIITPYLSDNNTDAYPRIKISGIEYVFAKSPKRYEGSMLNNGLACNFNMSVANDKIHRASDFIPDNWAANSKPENHPWVYPATSSIFHVDLNLLTGAQRLRQYTLGADPLHITPLMMAEMYGRLFSLHPDYSATVFESKKNATEEWDTTPKGLDIRSLYAETVYRGMKECANSGTAQAHLKNTKRDKYYLYAKTGTLTLNDNLKDDRMLAVVITNKDVSIPSNAGEARFYVIYFRFQQSGSMQNISQMINHIMESNSFKYYMEAAE